MDSSQIPDSASGDSWSVIYDSQHTGKSLRGRIVEFGKGMWESRQLAWQLFQRNLLANYRQSYLGWFWILLPPLASAGVWVFLNASGTLRISALGVVGYAAFVFTGMFLWQAFIDGLTGPMNTLQANRAALTKLQFPREVFITLSLLESGFDFLTRVFVGILFLFGAGLLTWSGAVLLVFLWGPALIILGTAFGLWLAPFGLLYKDVGRTITLVSPLWMLLTPVIYPLPLGPAGTLMAWANPPAAVVQVARQGVVRASVTENKETPNASEQEKLQTNNVAQSEGEQDVGFAENPRPDLGSILIPAIFWSVLGVVLFLSGAVWLNISGPIVIERLAN